MPENYPEAGICEFNDVKERIAEIDPYNRAVYNDHDDLAISRLFADTFCDLARYNAIAKEWMAYTGKYWKKDTGAMMVETFSDIFIRALQCYAIEQINDKDYLRFISRYGNRGSRKRMIEDARSFWFVDADAFDRDPYILNVLNGVLNLKTGELLPHDPALMLSKICNVEYNPEARSEAFEKFLCEIMLDDKEKIAYLQRLFGYSLLGVNTLEQAFILFGSTTRNGKSTLLETFGHMLGDYALNVEPETLALKQRSSRSASGDIARLDGCRFLQCSEPPKRMKLDSALIKTLLGRDRITARHLYEREFEFVPCFTLFLNTNFLPVVSDDSLFSSGRIQLIPFDRHFTEEEQDRTLKDRLKSADNLSGVLNWALEGLREFFSDGGTLTAPDVVKEATADYREDSDKIKKFIDDCLIPAPNRNLKIKDAYFHYQTWCDENGFGCENKSNFIEDMKSKGLFRKSGTVDGKTVRNIVPNHAFTII